MGKFITCMKIPTEFLVPYFDNNVSFVGDFNAKISAMQRRAPNAKSMSPVQRHGPYNYLC